MALLQEVLSPRQDHTWLLQPFSIHGRDISTALEAEGPPSQPIIPGRSPWFYLDGVYWGAPGVTDAETTCWPSPSI